MLVGKLAALLNEGRNLIFGGLSSSMVQDIISLFTMYLGPTYLLM